VFVVRDCPDTLAESLVNRFFVWTAPTTPNDVSATAVGAAGGVTVGVYVDDPY